MTAMDVVDLSGAMQATLSGYRAVLVAYQQKVTGDPAALRNAAQALRTDADQLAAAATTIQQGADSLGTDWSGDAYDAYHGASGQLVDDILAAARSLRTRADQLNAQATALQQARADVDAIIAWFDQTANQQIAASSHAAVWAIDTFQGLADQVGREAVQLAQQVADQLGNELVGPDNRGFAHNYLKVGPHGISQDAGFGRSIDFTGNTHVEGGGISFDATGGIGIGLHDREAFNASYDQGHLKVGVAASAIEGVGLTGSMNLDVDVPKVAGEIADGAAWLYDGAVSAARTVAESYAQAIQQNPWLLLP